MPSLLERRKARKVGQREEIRSMYSVHCQLFGAGDDRGKTTTALIMPKSKNLGHSYEINRQLLINTMINKPLNLVLVELAETSTFDIYIYC